MQTRRAEACPDNEHNEPKPSCAKFKLCGLTLGSEMLAAEGISRPSLAPERQLWLAWETGNLRWLGSSEFGFD
jgi:hypothetical protein